MSCIISLINKGNVEVIGKNSIKLLSYENLSEYELEILSLLFNDVNQIIEFDDIFKVLLKDEKHSKNFAEKIKNIKTNIENELFDLGIYSKIGKVFLSLIKSICIMLYVNICYFIYLINTSAQLKVSNIIVLNEIIAIILIIYSFIKSRKILVDKIKKINYYEFWVIITVIIMCALGIAILNFNKYIEIYFLLGILLILNTILILKTNTNIFTKKGKKEYEKAYGLKEYIKDYSLIKDRDIDSAIVWDEYLAYAVAFSIPNKVTNKINEKLIKANSAIEKINNTMDFH